MEGVVDVASNRSLVIGASGQIGEHCLAALGAAAAGTYLGHRRAGLRRLDIRELDALDGLVSEVRPDVIYLTACRADVEWCEANADEAWETNVGGVRNVAEVAKRHAAKLVFFSTEYVFDGRCGPYAEDAATNPLSVYGAQKLAAEHVIAEASHRWLIIRTTVVYSVESQRKNFVMRLVDTLREGRSLSVPADQWSSPTYAPDLVDAVLELVRRDAGGVFHVAGPRVVSRYEFALAAAQSIGLDETLLVPVTTDELGQRARRPLQAGLIVDKVQRTLGRPMLDFEKAFERMSTAHALS